MILGRQSEIKIYRLNVQSILSKKEQLGTLVHDLGPNCIFCFTKTWICAFDDINVFNPDKDTVVSELPYFADRNANEKK